MPNGKLGDGWLSDLRIHDVAPFDDEHLDAVIREIVALGAHEEAELIIDPHIRGTGIYWNTLKDPEIRERLRPELEALLERIRKDRQERGWQIS